MKNLKNLGVILNKQVQQAINGGWACVKCPVGCHCVRSGVCVSNDGSGLCVD